MLNYEEMYGLAQNNTLYMLFCLDSMAKKDFSLQHRAVLNRTIQCKFPTKKLLPAATAHMEDMLRDATRPPSEE